eukprot:m.10776 g.10776  ORF g.10776 m.10776 type:complete len:327 (+) comp7489_c0_seq1:91-1071(+)
MGACWSKTAANGTGARPGQNYIQDTMEDDTPDPDALQHISEREEHEEHEIAILHDVLPTSAKKSTGSPTRKASSSEFGDGLHNSKKFNSTSTLFVDSTVTQPNLEETLKCVALALHYIIIDGHKQAEPQLYAKIFDEKKFPLTDMPVPNDYDKNIPSDEEICVFMNRLFQAAALTAECGIITLVYINRAKQYANLTVHASNWKRILLGGILMASKVWDDQAIWNVDFCTILPNIAVEDMNELERTFLEMLQFNINVNSSVYAKYYFELRALAEQSNKAFPLEPLNKDSATKLEAMSASVQKEATKSKMRNARSLDFKNITSPAILS